MSAAETPDWITLCHAELATLEPQLLAAVDTLWRSLLNQSDNVDYHRRLEKTLETCALVANPALLKALLLYGLKEAGLAQADWAEPLASTGRANLATIAEHALQWREEQLVATADLYQKHLCVLSGHLWPAGTNVLDPHNSLPRTALLRGPTTQRFKFAAVLLRHGRHDWMEQHTYQPYTHLYHVDGFHAYYRNMAAWLTKHPEIKGFYGTSWFYDPRMDELSPHLGYLREPLEWGGSLFYVGPDLTGNAVATSKSRRLAQEQGRYVPSAYLLLWPRAGVLRWAAAHPEPA